ncbi:uncharacterized protein FFUJ_03485 [Fusarium fujikuroi IMI 58289]|uniref:RING-type domain-containing protein n=1 Tax=Gibberella fujikuroi (strain CBS 195.34 / IMI 58289 / NRRL A-6831) TaxID=1279085 RepID=S0E190_GIBF5|nr:uncharacterized protein FFUJ_03485 [Fusarium fujikuroi IMI 58289]KLP13040.1 uncharacterized protein LW94_2365 [Fusarium fujikuroi]CCT66453.1 uncharacterized protein FFUJ_03485 [Fusarium fujikuroi IMI 58289]SCN81135.1 uncharacterized protein FFM5_02670 [Fusarium fujikuroi]SCO32427.1 uncharacterized protein FFMR_02428 [Fusarium fujikuroi]
MSHYSKPLPEAFWPTIKQAIDKGSNTNSDNQAITPQCPICMEPLPVKSFPTEGELDAEVLLCGHVLCQPCRETWEQSQLGARCPACRATLICSRCEVNAIPLTIPKNGEGSSLPPAIPEGTQKFCPDCQAEVEFHEAVENGEWPNNLDDMEPGFVSFFYHVVNDIEKDGGVATEGRVQEAISDTIMQEFSNMMESRRMVTLGRGNTLRQANPWYAENSRRQENRRVGVIGFDSDDDPEPRANTPAGVPHLVRDPFVLRVGDSIEVRFNPLDPRYANQFDVQDGIAPANAAAPRPDNVSPIVRAIWGPEIGGERRAQDDDRQPPDADELRHWAEFLALEGNSSPATAEAARPAAGSMADQSRSTAPRAASQTTARPTRNHPEGSAAAILEQFRPLNDLLERRFTRPADMPTFDELVDNADAYTAAHLNDDAWPPRTYAEYVAADNDYLRRIVENRTAASSSSASQNLSSMDQDDSAEMSSNDQPVSER